MAKVLLEMKSITKTFPGVKALDNVNLKVEEGEIHALVGENGAGKSTLMNVLSGIYPIGTYEGDIIYNGEVCKFHNIKDSEKKGIVIIHQELALIPYMTIGENMFLGNEQGNKWCIDWNKTYAEADKYLEMVGLSDSSKTLIKDIGTGKQQLVEIAKALAKHAKLLILDEPTSSLNETDSRALLDLMKKLKAEGMTMIIISHKLNEVSYVADKITVVRDGSTIETLDAKTDDISETRIIKGMVGREITDRFPKRHDVPIGDVMMEVDNWTVYHPEFAERKVCNDVSINVRAGEVVGIYGLMGAGRTELAMSIFGRSYGIGISGDLKLRGKSVVLKSPKQAIEAGLAYVTEDRKGNGLVLSNSILRNTTLANLSGVSSGTFIDQDKEIEVAQEYVDRLKTKTPSVDQLVGNLSGGNQQKVLLAKWMFADPDVLILDEPTRGIDVGAKYEIYCIINDLAKAGKSVVMISSELPEVIGMSDRIYIMNQAKIVGEMKASDATQENIMEVIVKQGSETTASLAGEAEIKTDYKAEAGAGEEVSVAEEGSETAENTEEGSEV
ncbi:MAG: sugar ABC transporter ATP-binding protein [Saccharofermentans sp.]|nr:sugar ABC transporter ATP-binding protein [Saccharofermentans sp.]